MVPRLVRFDYLVTLNHFIVFLKQRLPGQLGGASAVSKIVQQASQ
jgi:hypothetical protein